MGHHKQPRTPGGMRLRALREAAGKSQFTLELDASLGTGYLQRLELGKVQQPERDTLERILAALGVNYAGRREVLALFGYTPAFTLPDETEIHWAKSTFAAEAGNAIMPAYLLDCSHRLLAWNGLASRLFGGFNSADNILMPRVIFDTVYGVAEAILNADDFFPAQIRILQYEGARLGDASWHNRFMDDMRQYDVFDHYWREQASYPPIPMRDAATLRLDTGRGVAHFRLIAETFAQDNRFRVIHYLPADVQTIIQCQAWWGH